MTKVIHKQIAKVAKALAAEAYEVMAHENAFFAMWPSQAAYVRHAWKEFIPYARDSLFAILNKDYSFEIAMGSYTPAQVQKMKDDIYEVILIDSAFKAPGPSSAIH